MSFRTQLTLYFLALACMAAAVGVHDSIFNNFLSDTFHLTADQRGHLEFPRELPGFLTVLMAGVLATMAVTRVAGVGALTFAVGIASMAVWGGSFGPMVLTMMVASAGLHLLQPVGQTIALGLSEAGNRGRRMGQAGAVSTAGTVLGTGSVVLLFGGKTPPYVGGFLAVAVLGILSGLVYVSMRVPHLDRPRPRLIVREKYSLYYMLEFLFGARKQVFLTFGPWVLIQVYGAEAKSIASLLMVAAILGIFLQPLIGMAIDHLGERKVMVLDGLVLSVVCIGYGYAMVFMGSPERALPVASACYVLDNLLFALGTARAVYLSHMSDSPEEVSSTLGLGVSINHIASMTIPTVAGALWMNFGYERVFLAAAILALGTAALALRVPRKMHPIQATPEPELAPAE